MTVTDLGRRAQSMLDALAALTDEPGRITRLYLSPAHRRSVDLVTRWMQEAGLAVTMDALGTVRGARAPGMAGRQANRRLLVGSHIDTVVDAGRYDGTLGVVAGILAVQELDRRGIALPFGLDILAFGDEEGVRFPTTLASSSAVAGILPPSALELRDGDGILLSDALVNFGCNPEEIALAAMSRDDVLGYLEVHIEQGPVLEIEQQPLAIVTSIAGQSRFHVTVSGDAGHAGTVPMTMRRDALAAAAEMMLAIETVARKGRADELVATVGRLSLEPGAVNVIPRRASFTLDIRAARDEPRLAAIAEIRKNFNEIAERRSISFLLDRYHDTPTTPCGQAMMTAIGTALDDLGLPRRELTSGAGHDGHAMHALTDIGMIFVRCRGGISHNPNEFADVADIGLAVEALTRAIIALAETPPTD